jgi:hypothetical protein
MNLRRNIVMVFTTLFTTLFITLLFGMLVGMTNNLHAQGFNWQYSSRLPTGYPTLFVGVVGSAMQSQHQAMLRYTKIENGKECDCKATFTNTTSIDFTGGVIAEYWLPDANMALYGVLQAEQRNAQFIADGPIEPVNFNNLRELTTKYLLTTSVINASIEAGFKVKFTPLPLFASIGLQAASILTTQKNVEQNSTNPRIPYSVKNLPTDFLILNPFVAGAKASIGADFALSKSMYASPSLFASLPFGSLSGGENTWSRLSYGVQVAFLLGFMP